MICGLDFGTSNSTIVVLKQRQQTMNTVFTTGGSTALPMLKAGLRKIFPSANQIAGDLYNSVRSGLLKRRCGGIDSATLYSYGDCASCALSIATWFTTAVVFAAS